MTKQVHKYSLGGVLTENITKQTDVSSTQVEDDVLIRVRTFLMKKNNLLGFSNSTN
jgi:hypothetical protein